MKILAIFIFFMAFTNANIFNFKYFTDYFKDRNLLQSPTQQLKKFHDVIVKFFEKGEHKVKMEKTKEPDEQGFKINFKGADKQDEECFIEGLVYQNLDNTIEINFVNSVDSSNLIYSNIDLEDENEIKLLEEKYLTQYFNHLEEILYDQKQKDDVIVGSVKKALQDKYKITVEQIENEGKENKHVFQVSLLEKGKDAQKDATSQFDILIEIYGIENKANFITNFFESDFSLSISTETYIDHQVQKLAKKVESHFNKLRRFSNNDNQTQIECEKILESFDTAKENFAYEFVKIENDSDPNSGSIQFKLNQVSYPPNDSGVHIEYSCQEFGGEYDDMAYVVSITLEEGVDPIKQIFFKQSLYDLSPVAESFWEEIFDLLIKFYAPETLDSVKIFKDAIISYQTKEQLPEDHESEEQDQNQDQQLSTQDQSQTKQVKPDSQADSQAQSNKSSSDQSGQSDQNGSQNKESQPNTINKDTKQKKKQSQSSQGNEDDSGESTDGSAQQKTDLKQSGQNVQESQTEKKKKQKDAQESQHSSQNNETQHSSQNSNNNQENKDKKKKEKQNQESTNQNTPNQETQNSQNPKKNSQTGSGSEQNSQTGSGSGQDSQNASGSGQDSQNASGSGQDSQNASGSGQDSQNATDPNQKQQKTKQESKKSTKSAQDQQPNSSRKLRKVKTTSKKIMI